MTTVRLGGPLKSAAGGQTEFEIEAGNVRELLSQLAAACPRLRPVIEEGVSVAIDGEIYRDAWFKRVPPGAEVYILPKLAGG